MKRKVLVHVGPHKTGSTAIQTVLMESGSSLAEAGIQFMHDKLTHETALYFSQGEFDAAQDNLAVLAKQISESQFDRIILSQEDFCGDLPGRTRSNRVYPNFTKILRAIERGLRPHEVTFVFFERDEVEWLTSCYHQHLRYRTLFCDIHDFFDHFQGFKSWEDFFDWPRKQLGAKFITLPYDCLDYTAGVRRLVSLASGKELELSPGPRVCNPSPSPHKVRLLERINQFSSFRETAWFCKSLVLADWKPRALDNVSSLETLEFGTLAELALPRLSKRATGRVQQHDAVDLLPSEDCDLTDYIFRSLPSEVEQPSLSRAKIEDQSLILDYHFRGKSALAKLNALVISYLRRSTPVNSKARRIFHRIWREHGAILVNELTTRWLISTLQTFLDHGENEAQRLIGASGHFYGNMMKIYEGERAIEGRAQDATYSGSRPSTPNRFTGLDRFEVGGTDLLLNTNALAVDLAARDDCAGLVMIELLLRVKNSANVFTRMDQTRKAKNIEIFNFSDTWSFFEEPKAKF